MTLQLKNEISIKNNMPCNKVPLIRINYKDLNDFKKYHEGIFLKFIIDIYYQIHMKQTPHYCKQ